MIPIYVINLKRRADRKQKMLDQFEKCKITNFKFVEAIDAKRPSDISKIIKAYNQRRAEKENKPLVRADVAISLSHIKAYRTMMADGYDNAIILEDDAVLEDNFVESINRLENRPEEFIMLGYYSSYEVDVHHKTNENVVYVTNGIKDTKVFLDKPVTNDEVFYKFKYPTMHMDFIYGYHGYYITQSGANKIINLNQSVFLEGDQALNYLTDEFDYACLYPQSVMPTKIDSDIDGRSEMQQSIVPRKDRYVWYLGRYLHKDYGSL